jgi:hypothetical protein
VGRTALQVVQALGLNTVAALENRTPELVAAQLVGLAPDPEAAANRAEPGILGKFGDTIVPVIASFFPGAGTISKGLTAYQQSQDIHSAPTTIQTKVAEAQNLIGGAMWPFDTATDSTGFDQGLVSDAGSSFDWNSLLNLGTSVAQNFLVPSGGGNLPVQLAASPGLPAVMAAGGMVARMGGALATRFPALAARLASLQLTRAGAYSLLKKFGPTALTGMGFAALEVAQLASSGSGRRRMNICNGRALRRASRRVQAFHNFYKRTCGTSIHRRKRKC